MKTTKHPHMGSRFRVEPNHLLRERESEALLWLAEGKSAAEAGLIMGTTARTQKAYRMRAMDRLKANNGPSLVAMAFYHKLITCLCLVLVFMQIGMSVQTRDMARRAPRPPFTRQVARLKTRQDRGGLRAA